MRLNQPVITILQYTVGQGSVTQMVLNSSKVKYGNIWVCILSCIEKACQNLEEDKCTNV